VENETVTSFLEAPLSVKVRYALPAFSGTRLLEMLSSEILTTGSISSVSQEKSPVTRNVRKQKTLSRDLVMDEF
jgi:hypothetical protein